MLKTSKSFPVILLRDINGDVKGIHRENEAPELEIVFLLGTNKDNTHHRGIKILHILEELKKKICCSLASYLASGKFLSVSRPHLLHL